MALLVNVEGRRLRALLLFVITLWLNLSPHHSAAAGTLTLLHEFANNGDGFAPYSGVVSDGTTLYGTTQAGPDAFGSGTIYKVRTDGSDFVRMRGVNSADGTTLDSGLVLGGTSLYGAAYNGGASGLGTIYKISTTGTTVQVLHSFAGGTSDGSHPISGLVLSGSVLYGATQQGGSAGFGTVFKVNTDGTGFQILHTFAGGTTDGREPSADLVLSGGTLYGTTVKGGSTSNNGTAFKVNIDGTGFQLLHQFGASSTDGKSPTGGLALSGSTLYGTTESGGGTGLSNQGTLYQINTDGTGYSILHRFVNSISDGAHPEASPLVVGSTIYGITKNGGDVDLGTLFSIDVNGTGFKLLHEFLGGVDDGGNPNAGSLYYANSVLYGTTSAGGNANAGTVFSFAVPEPSSLSLAFCAVIAFSTLRCIRRK